MINFSFEEITSLLSFKDFSGFDSKLFLDFQNWVQCVIMDSKKDSCVVIEHFTVN